MSAHVRIRQCIQNRFYWFRIRWCFLLIASSLSAITCASEVKIDLRERVILAKENVTLGDIANVSSSDLSALLRVINLPIGRAPQSGHNVVLERDSLVRWLGRSLRMTGHSVVWGGAIQTVAVTTSQEVTGGKIVDVAKVEMLNWLQSFGDKNVVELIHIPKTVTVPEGDLKLTVRALSKDAMPSPRMNRLVDIYVSGKFIRTVSVSFDVSVFKKAVVATKDLKLGDMIQESDIEFKEVQIAGKLFPLIIDDVADRKLRTKFSLRRGELITMQNVEPLPLALRGEWATLVVRSGSFEMESQVEVLREGRLGDVVPVKGKNTSGMVMAKIIAEGRLEMKL